MSQLLSFCLRDTSVSGKPHPRWDDNITFEAGKQVVGLSCVAEGIVAFDGKIVERKSALQVPPINEEGLSGLGQSASRASFRTASTELYVPPDSRDEECLKNGCVSGFKNETNTLLIQKVEDATQVKMNHKKRRRRSDAELATEDVDSAIASVVNAAEAVVIGNLLTPGFPSRPDRSICMEAALSLSKARHFCGLDKYDLHVTTWDAGDSEMESLDHKAMQEAYSDVGMIVEVPHIGREGQTGSIVAVGHPEDIISYQGCEGNVDNVRVRVIGMQVANAITENCQPPVVGGSPSKGNAELTMKRRRVEEKVKEGESGEAVEEETDTSVELVSLRPETKLNGTVSQAPRAAMMIKDMPSNSGVVGCLQYKAEHPEEVQGGEAIAINVGVMDNKAIQSLESVELHAELSLPSQGLAVTGTKWSCRDVVKNVVALKDPSHDDATCYSRWLGGWPGNADLNQVAAFASVGRINNVKSLSSTSLKDVGSEYALPEQTILLARQRSTPFIQESQTVSVHETVAECFPQNDEATSGKCVCGDSSQAKYSHSQQTLHVSQEDPLCMSPPAALSLLFCNGDNESDLLAAAVEACARTALKIVESQKVVDHQEQAGRATELESAPDHALRTPIETYGSQQGFETRSVSPATIKGSAVKRRLISMKNLSTTPDTLSLLLQAAHIAGKSLTKDGGDGLDLERPRTPSPNLISRSSPLDIDCPEAVQIEEDLRDFVVDDGGRKGLPKRKGMASPDLWTCADFSESPPLLWPRGKKRKLAACRVVDSDSTGYRRDDADGHQIAEEDVANNEDHTLQNVNQQLPGGPILRTWTRSNKLCHDSKSLFVGFQFLLTGFSPEKKEKLSKSIKRHGGVLLADVPTFSPKQRFKRRGVDCGARNPPIVFAPQQMRTQKYLYGCAVGSPLLNARWISASVSAFKCLPYHEYQHKQTRAGSVLRAEEGRALHISNGIPLFHGFQFLFHGQQDFISQLSTLAKHAGGKVIRKLVLNESKRKQGQKLVGLVVVEGSWNLPLDLQRTASKLELQIVDSEWMIVSLLNGKLLPFESDSTPPSSVLPSQQSSSSKTSEPLQRRKPRKVRFETENLESKEGAGSKVELLVKQLKDSSFPDECRPNCSGSSKSGGKELEEEGYVHTCWLGKGFTSPPVVRPLADRLLGPYSQVLAQKKLPKKFLYYEAFICNGVEYFIGDIVEVRASVSGCPQQVARIEGLWSEEGGGRRLPQTRAFQQGVRKKAFKDVALKCRRFYRPSDTGFPGQQRSNSSSVASNELYLSNDIVHNVSAADIVRRVRVKLEAAGEVLQCTNWYDNDEDGDDGGQDRAAGSAICRKKGPTATTAGSVSDYFCSFFYNNSQESLHRIKLDV